MEKVDNMQVQMVMSAERQKPWERIKRKCQKMPETETSQTDNNNKKNIKNRTIPKTLDETVTKGVTYT